jgi:hypothetical protein
MKREMKRVVLATMVVAGMLASGHPSHAASCVNGVYRAGCIGPNGAAVARKPPVTHPARPAVSCANGVYRAGCVGPNGAAVARKPSVTHPARPAVSCANGVYRAGCVGPNGAAVVRKH